MMKRILMLIMLVPSLALAAGKSAFPLDDPQNDIRDVESLKRGAQMFVQSCSSCHSANLIRYSRISQDLSWNEEEMRKALKMGDKEMGDYMAGGMNPVAAKAAFGTAIPDLTLTSRVRGTDWIYTYMRSFYTDENGKNNNVIFAGVAMPNVLMGHQGMMKPVYEERNGKQVVVGTQPFPEPQTEEEKAAAAEKAQAFDEKIRDLTNFMEYIGEPVKVEREELGKKVLFYLFILFIFAWLLKREYWKDIK